MMVRCTSKKILVEHVNFINQQDQNIAQYAKCAYQNMIITVFGYDNA